MEVECEWIVLSGGQHKQGPFYVTIRNSAIAAISSAPSASQGGSDLQRLSTHLLVPGFIDLHTHGVGEQDDQSGINYPGLTHHAPCTHIHCVIAGGSSDVLDFWLHPGRYYKLVCVMSRSSQCVFFPLKWIHHPLLSEHTQGVFPKQGTTSFLATVIFPKEYPEKTLAILSRLNEAVGKQGNGSIMEGIHAEVRGLSQIINY